MHLQCLTYAYNFMPADQRRMRADESSQSRIVIMQGDLYIL